MPETETWEVTDGYGKVWFTGTLKACGVWIDPVLGIELPGVSFGWTPGIDDDRFTVNDDGTITVTNYTAGGGIGGEFILRRTKP